MDEKEYLLKIIDELFEDDGRIKNTRLEADPGFIVADIGNKRFLIGIQEDSI